MAAACAIAGVGALVGCSGSSFGSDLAVRPAPKLIRDTDGKTMSFPRDGKFTIRLPQSSKQAGLSGTVDADAIVEVGGKASARAEVKNGGSGNGTVQLGHLLKNDTNRQIDLEIRTAFHFEFDVSCDPDEKLPGASVGVRLYVRDQRNRLLREFDLVQHSTEQGSVRRASDEVIEFNTTLGPDDAIAVFVAGQAAVETLEGRSATATLNIDGMTMDITTNPAPAVQRAADVSN
ncbi:MAG: hypothetical protein AB7N71_02480 [Phycisphaerae bacterium]